MNSLPQDENPRRRPTLPPIRDLFREELSQNRNPHHDSPQLTLARLQVTDDSDFDRYTASPQVSSSRSYLQPTYRPPSTRPHSPTGRAYQGGYIGPPPPRHQHHPTAQGVDALHSMIRTDHNHNVAQRSTLLHEPTAHHEHEHLPQTMYTPQRNTLANADYHYNPRVMHYANDPRFAPHDPPAPSHPHNRVIGNVYPSPWAISTNIDRSHNSEDEERTPIARYHLGSTMPVVLSHPGQPLLEESTSISGSSKYECNYCGKGFNRPSSLKVMHKLNHTGEKPFVCPVEGCGRSFSVLSNMRRHARVHTQIQGKDREGSSDEGSVRTTSVHDPQLLRSKTPAYSPDSTSSRWHQRRGSTASTSSSSSRRSRSESSDEDEDLTHDRPEKRSRQ